MVWYDVVFGWAGTCSVHPVTTRVYRCAGHVNTMQYNLYIRPSATAPTYLLPYTLHPNHTPRRPETHIADAHSAAADIRHHHDRLAVAAVVGLTAQGVRVRGRRDASGALFALGLPGLYARADVDVGEQRGAGLQRDQRDVELVLLGFARGEVRAPLARDQPRLGVGFERIDEFHGVGCGGEVGGCREALRCRPLAGVRDAQGRHEGLAYDGDSGAS